MELPISGLLKRRIELETAQLEDDVISMLAGITDRMALHGGTAIWRCYGGKRFSTGIGLYVWDPDFKESFISTAGKIGVEVPKFREKGVTFIHVRKNNTEINVEPRNMEKEAILMPYERIDGSKMNMLVMSPEDLVLEKIEAYTDRRAYKDLYDITILLNSIKYPNKIRAALLHFTKSIPKPDEDVQSLAEFRATVYAGVIPTYEKMGGFISRWVA